MKTSTNALTARFCASKGWPVETVQSWRGRVRHDLFGIADSIILRPPRALLVQNCSYGTLKAHRDEIDTLPLLKTLQDIRGIQIQLWEWRKKKVGRRGFWFLRKQTLGAYGAWDEIGEWSEPLDLYPKPSRRT